MLTSLLLCLQISYFFKRNVLAAVCSWRYNKMLAGLFSNQIRHLIVNYGEAWVMLGFWCCNRCWILVFTVLKSLMFNLLKSAETLMFLPTGKRLILIWSVWLEKHNAKKKKIIMNDKNTRFQIVLWWFLYHSAIPATWKDMSCLEITLLWLRHSREASGSSLAHVGPFLSGQSWLIRVWFWRLGVWVTLDKNPTSSLDQHSRSNLKDRGWKGRGRPTRVCVLSMQQWIDWKTCW